MPQKIFPRTIQIASLNRIDAYDLPARRLLTPLQFYTFTACLPLDLVFDPNSEDGSIPECRASDYLDPSEVDRRRYWKPIEELDGIKGAKKSKNRPKKSEIARSYVDEDGNAQIRFTVYHETYIGNLLGEGYTDNPGIYPHTLRPIRATALAICFSVDDLSVLDAIPHRWLPPLRYVRPLLPIVLVGCNIDRRATNSANDKHKSGDPGNLCVTKEQGELMAQKIGAKYYIECSRRTGENMVLAYAAMLATALSALVEGRELWHEKNITG